MHVNLNLFLKHFLRKSFILMRMIKLSAVSSISAVPTGRLWSWSRS